MAVTASARGRSTFVVADSLAAQLWEMVLASENILAVASAWETPAIRTYAAWLEELWLEHAPEAVPPLSVGQSDALWRNVIAESPASRDLIGHGGAAAWAQDAWRLLARWRIDPRAQRAGTDQLDYGAFLDWCRGYRRRLDEHGWLDRAELEARLTARALNGAARVVAADLEDTYPARAALFSHLEDHGVEVGMASAPRVAATRRAVRLADSTEELRAALAWAKRRLEASPQARIAVVLTGVAERYAEIERALAGALADLAPGLGWAGGAPLGADPTVGAAYSALTLLEPTTGYAALGRWLRSPFFASTAAESFACAQLDRRLRGELRSRLAFAASYRCGLKELLAQTVPQTAAALAAGLAALGSVRRATPSRWAHLFTRFLVAVGWQPPSERATLTAWQGSLDELARLTAVMGEVRLADALAELERILARAAAPALPLAGVHVLGELDAVGPGYDAVWLTGFTDTAWPEPPRGNPLLPLALQRAHEMPYSSPRDAQARSARKLERVLERTRDVVVSWPARVYDYETEPSPVLRSWPALSSDEVRDLTGATRSGTTRIRETVPDPAPPHGGDRLPGGAGALGRQARCPLRAFCEYRLGARALERLGLGLSPRLRGIATHRAAEILLEGLPTQVELATRAGAVAPSVDRALGRMFGAARAQLGELYALEAEQLGRLLVALLEQEAARAPFRVRALEQKLDLVVERWTLGVRVDRIDELADGSIAIIDYKTGERASSADWFSPRLRDAQVPLYACYAEQSVGAAVVARVTPSDTSYSGLWRDGAFPGRPARQAAEPEAQLDLWRVQLVELASELAAGDTRILLGSHEEAAREYAPLTRVHEQLELARGSLRAW